MLNTRQKNIILAHSFVIGFSKTCYRTIVDIEVGDVLLISDNFAYAVIYNTKICDLIYPEELKMADHFEYEEDFETDDFDIKKAKSRLMMKMTISRLIVLKTCL